MTSTSTELYATAAEVKAQIDKSGNSGAGTTANFEIIIAAVSRNIDDICNRPMGFKAIDTATAKYYASKGGDYLFIDECVAVESVSEKSSPSAATYDLLDAEDWLAFAGSTSEPNFNKTPYNGIMRSSAGNSFGRSSYWQGRFKRSLPTIKVMAKWGYAVNVPGPIKEVCIVETVRIWKRAQSAFADALAPIDMGQLAYVKQMDPITKNMLIDGRFVRPRV
jgi:hypothetical protein